VSCSRTDSFVRILLCFFVEIGADSVMIAALIFDFFIVRVVFLRFRCCSVFLVVVLVFVCNGLLSFCILCLLLEILFLDF
jgi:hypothetical protein